MSFYELVAVTPTTLKDKKKLLAEIESWLKEAGVSVKKQKDWGKRELAYPIKKQKEANYFFWLLEAEPKKIVELEAKIRLESDIIRHLLTKEGGG